MVAQMELMSSLLLCVLVALLPQTLGKSRIKPVAKLEIKFNNTLLLHQKPTLRRQLLLNINGPPLVSNITEIQSVFTDVICKKCHYCMDRAIKAYLNHDLSNKNRPSAEELQEDVFLNEISYRTKRDIVPTDESIPEASSNSKKAKTKKSKMNKSVTVTKYNMDGEVYALKVKERQVAAEVNDSRSFATCQVYNVKKSYPCDSPESDSLLASARRKVNKKKAKKGEKSKTSTSTTQKTQLSTLIFRKREVDNSHIPENFMPSIEELY